MLPVKINISGHWGGGECHSLSLLCNSIHLLETFISNTTIRGLLKVSMLHSI